jgi:RNA polymerase sigma-70 factor (ECF subfamily)
MGTIPQGVQDRMTAADKQQVEPRGGTDVPSNATASAVSQLFRDHNRLLVGYLTSRLGSEQEAKELAQESYVRLLQLQNPGDPSLLRAYLFKTATNLAIDRLRHRRVQHQAEEQPQLFESLTAGGVESHDPASQLVEREETAKLLGYLQELPLKCQQVFSLHRLDGFTQNEVAVRIAVSERMVRRYVTYAMVYCRLRLDGMAADDARRKVSL